MEKILAGIRIFEFTTAIQGPAAGQFLADLGAEVIKVEPPLGDSARYVGIHNTPGSDAGSQFIATNRGKKSVCLDAHTALGRSLLHKLAASADVFLSNYRAPALKRMGLDEETLRGLNSQLIYAAVSGFGPLGVDANKAMVDGAAQARGGLVNMLGMSDQRPVMSGSTIADTSGALMLALGVVTALLARERLGKAMRVDTSSLAAQTWLQMWELQHTALTGANLQRSGSHHPLLNGPVGVYTSKDGVHFLFALLLDVNAWQALWAFAGDPERAFDPRWDLTSKQFNVGAGGGDVGAIRTYMLQAFAQRTAAEWEAFFASQPELICERVRDYHGVLSDPANTDNGFIAEMQLSSDRPVKTVGNPLVFDHNPRLRYGPPPDRGDATAAVMRSLGFSDAEITQLEEETEAWRRRALQGSG